MRLTQTATLAKSAQQRQRKRRLIIGACFMFGLSLLLLVGSAGYFAYIVFVPGLSQATQPALPLSDAERMLAGRIYSGDLQTSTGSGQSVRLILLPDRRRFELETRFGDRSAQPTIRSGRWHSAGDRLWLDILELDGEPISQPPLQFQFAGDLLVAQSYDRRWFDYDQFELLLSGELGVDSAE